MQMIAQLCDRAILLDGGRVIADGEADVVAEHLQSGLGSSSARDADDDTAPGDDVARLRFARVIDEDGATVSSTDIRSPVGIQIKDPRTEPMAFAKLKLIDRRGDIAFNALDARSRPATAFAPGDYVATGVDPRQPAQRRADGNRRRARLDRRAEAHHHAQERQALAFHVVDPGAGIRPGGRSRGSCAA